jgi:hypothetical protein
MNSHTAKQTQKGISVDYPSYLEKNSTEAFENTFPALQYLGMFFEKKHNRDFLFIFRFRFAYKIEEENSLRLRNREVWN